jgi:hypothetical protein
VRVDPRSFVPSSGELDWVTASPGYGFASGGSCADGGTPGILGATVWATATDGLGNVSRIASVRLP